MAGFGLPNFGQLTEAFRKAHAQARTPEGLLTGHPRLLTFEAVIEQDV